MVGILSLSTMRNSIVDVQEVNFEIMRTWCALIRIQCSSRMNEDDVRSQWPLHWLIWNDDSKSLNRLLREKEVCSGDQKKSVLNFRKLYSVHNFYISTCVHPIMLCSAWHWGFGSSWTDSPASGRNAGQGEVCGGSTTPQCQLTSSQQTPLGRYCIYPYVYMLNLMLHVHLLCSLPYISSPWGSVHRQPRADRHGPALQRSTAEETHDTGDTTDAGETEKRVWFLHRNEVGV